MVRHRGAVLVDTNVILECWRIDAWRALAGGYRIETVEDCVIETQTGYQRRRVEQTVDVTMLHGGLAARPHPVSDMQRAALALKVPDIQLDTGERSLWAHVLHRTDNWVLCGPDKASLRMGVRLGYRERLISLETLFEDAGYRSRTSLASHFSAAWHARTVSQMAVMERRD